MNNSKRTSFLAGSLGRALQKKINERIKELAKNLQINEQTKEQAENLQVNEQTKEQAKNRQELQELKKLEIIEKEILCLELGGLCHDLGMLKLTYVYSTVYQNHVRVYLYSF